MSRSEVYVIEEASRNPTATHPRGNPDYFVWRAGPTFDNFMDASEGLHALRELTDPRHQATAYRLTRVDTIIILGHIDDNPQEQP